MIERPLSSTANDVVIAKTPFELTITQTLPWAATTTLEGSFEGEVDTNATTLKVTFNKASVKADGTNYALNLPSGNAGARFELCVFARHDVDSGASYFAGSETLAGQIIWLWTTGFGKAFRADG